MIKNCLPYGLVKKILPNEIEIPIESIHSNPPEVYAADGKRIFWIYLNDNECKHCPYTFSAGYIPKYIIWDRYNYGLSRHMYTHEEVFSSKGTPQKKFALLIECKYVISDVYERLLQDINILKEYDAVFTNQEDLLNIIDNGYHITSSAPWYGTIWGGGGRVTDKNYEYKNKLVSIVSSDKEMCELHKFRKSLALSCKGGVVDCYGTFDSGKYVKCAEYLEDYMYHIVVENQISDGYFTEKITNCFKAMTIPIYIGCRDIGKYFNTDGIIQIREVSLDKVNSAIRQCSREDYMNRVVAIKDNYMRVKECVCLEDCLYHNYGYMFA